MTYIPDGADKDYYRTDPGQQHFAWGWLSSDKQYPTGWEDKGLKEEFVAAVEELERVDLFRGTHTDEGLGLTFGEDCPAYANGSRKFTADGIVYTAPGCVPYYIRELDYRPPDQVVEALLNEGRT